ncbi:MAG TPA: glycosyltransferase family 25 protein [Stellaceae bacterium]|nr:glycosyltransferase family 25 protein [Stellaceae bacterium]
MSYAGFYINLDRSTARRAEMEAEFARFGLERSYRRFPGADGNTLGFPNPHLTASEMGCFTSHYRVLKENSGSTKHLHILEDDAVLSRFTAEAVNSIVASEVIRDHDVVFTDTLIQPLNADYRTCKALYDRSVRRDGGGKVTGIDPSFIEPNSCATSYIVNRDSIGKLVAIYEQELAAGARVNADLVLRDKARDGAIRTVCVFPFVTSFRLERLTSDTITGRPHDPLSDLAINLARHSFFVDSDPASLLRTAERLLPLPRGDAHFDLLNRVLGFSMTGQFQRF